MITSTRIITIFNYYHEQNDPNNVIPIRTVATEYLPNCPRYNTRQTRILITRLKLPRNIAFTSECFPARRHRQISNPASYLASWTRRKGWSMIGRQMLRSRNHHRFRDMHALAGTSRAPSLNARYARLSYRDGCSIMSTCSTCRPFQLNRSPDYPMTHNARLRCPQRPT